MQWMGALTAVKGAGIIGTFVTLEGIRFFTGWPSQFIFWPMLMIGLLMIGIGLGVIAAHES